MDKSMIGLRTRVREDLCAIVTGRTIKPERSWAAGLYGIVLEWRKDAWAGTPSAGPGAVRILFESCPDCNLPSRCQGNHWIKIEDLAIQNSLDVVFDVLPLLAKPLKDVV